MNHPLSNPSSAPVLSIRNLSVALRSDGKDLVRNVSFDVHAGETVCVVGESGSGKSVTAFSVMGLLDAQALAPSAGQIMLSGEDVLRASPARLRELRATRMSMVFQEPMTALNPVEKVGAQIDEVLRLHRKMSPAARKRRILDMLDQVHLPDPARIYNSYPHQLSGGQRQRVVISMALILDPQLLIADEPTTALDVSTQKQILSLIAEMQQKHGTAVLFITHDFGVVADIADKVVVMKRGDVVEVGSRDRILGNPAQDYTRMLVASVPSLVPPQRAPINTPPALKVSALTKTFVSRRLLRAPQLVHAAADVDLVVRKGEVLGVVGQSGSGKSTVARAIIRLEQPDHGHIEIEGNDIAGLKGAALRHSRQKIQMVFQDPYRSLNPRVTVLDTLTEGPTNFGVPPAEARARAAQMIERVGLTQAALQRYPHQFSGGQRQRIAIARALMLDPQVLVADEAVSALDVSVQAQILTLLDQICRETGLALLFITHDLRVAAQICDRVMVMNKGKVVEAGPTHQVLTQPADAYTRALLDAAPGRDWDFPNFRALTNA